ncbi:MAG: hypothetical protein NWE98_03245 [Candidatus Bathyarchaeota archaeon]|nr:hypothetical protein [Candidatus Bathyarchaeota archaeon]
MDGSELTVTLTGMGIIQALKDDELQNSYVYRRDFSETLSPIDKAFSFDRFEGALSNKNINLKAMLVGKEAVVVGLGNSSFQDIIFRAGIHPKRRASDLTGDERYALYNSIKQLIADRIRLGGKDQFIDFYGKWGSYKPSMGPNMKGKNCVACGGAVEHVSIGGGQVFYCPNCQH